jgi:hypothetical protein
MIDFFNLCLSVSCAIFAIQPRGADCVADALILLVIADTSLSSNIILHPMDALFCG